jgi:ubiquinone/menaquinone biosynthesis C-methylase UbiE
VVEPLDRLIRAVSTTSSHLTGEGIIIDIGTGDGLFVYQCARENPAKLFIGIDANPRPLEKISEKIHRKPGKGGLSNAIFVQSAVEDLPSELDGIADEVHIHFPWGSLLRAMAIGDHLVLRNIRRICSSGALLEVVIGLDPERDRSETERLGLPPITTEYIASTLARLYAAAGFEIVENGAVPPSEWPALHSSWAKRLKGSNKRELIYIVARAIENEVK